MVRGIAAVCLVALMALAAPVSAAWIPGDMDSIHATVPTARVEILLPPGADVSEARGSLTVEKLPVTSRVLADGSVTRTLPVEYTFVNHWNETFMFDGFNEAVLTDGAGDKLFASSVLRDGEILLTGVTGLIPRGGMTEFTLFYDLKDDTTDAALAEMQLDLRYLNHGHPYFLSTLIASEPGAEERPNVVEFKAPPVAPPVPVAPPPVVPEKVVKEAPAPPPAPVYVPPPVVPAPPTPMVAQAPPIMPPAVMAQPPAPPPPAPRQVNQIPCMPCQPCQPVCNPCCLLQPLLALPCCLANVALKGVCCLTCVTTKGVCEITCGTTSAVSCALGSVCSCNPCGPCGR